MSELSCNEVEENVVEWLESGASEALLDHLERCDRCRDLLHDAKQAAALVRAAGREFALSPAITARIETALDGARGPDHGDALAGDAGSEVAKAAGEAHAKESAEPSRAERAQETTRSVGAGASAGVSASGRATGDERRWARWLPVVVMAAGLAAWAAVGLGGRGRGSESARSEAQGRWRGVLEKVRLAGDDRGGVEVCHAGSCRGATEGESIDVGSTLRTSEHGLAHLRLEDGTIVAVERSTSLAIDADGGRATLEHGVIDVNRDEGDEALALSLGGGVVTLLRGRYEARLLGSAATLLARRGGVRLEGPGDTALDLPQGRTATWLGEERPRVTGARRLAAGSAWDEDVGDGAGASRGLGELRAKKPGSDEERSGAVRLRQHHARVRVVDGFARIEIDETFSNETDDVLEGIYRFPLPPDAQIERLALEVDGKLEDGAFVDRERAAAIWRGAIVNGGGTPKPREEIVWVPGPWRDPALLEWQRGGRFELRIFPIPRRGQRRIVLAYTQALDAEGGVRRLTVPLPYALSRELRVDDLSMDVEVRGHDRSLGVQAHGYEARRESRGDADALRVERHDVVPSGDLVVEFGVRDREARVTTWAYALAADEGGAPDRSRHASRDEGAVARESVRGNYAAIALRPEWSASPDDRPRAIALVVDSSRSMTGEHYRRAVELAARVTRELDARDRFTVLACDTTCRSLGEPRHPDSHSEHDLREFLNAAPPAGGSDPSDAVVSALSGLRRVEGHSPRVLFLGDGTPTVGALRPATIAATLSGALAPDAAVHAVAIGADADLESLGALARAGRGLVLPFEPGRPLADVATAAVAALGGTGLSNVSLELPPGLAELAPRAQGTLLAGRELLVTARMMEPRVRGDVVLRGRLGETEFEQRFPVDVEATTNPGNGFVPRLHAGMRIRDLERDGGVAARAEAILLSGRFDVASRYTSLLVLESPAMFRAFGLDNERAAPDWTGESEAKSRSSDGEDATKASEEARSDGPFGGAEAGDASSSRAMGAPSLDAAPSSPAPSEARASARVKRRANDDFAEAPVEPWTRPEGDLAPPVRRPPPAPWRDLVPMRVVWQREIRISDGSPSTAATAGIAALEDELARDENRRGTVKKLVGLHALAGNLDRASRLAERWLEKEPLDADALTVTAELVAARGMREQAIRGLGSVVDVRPGDAEALLRLAEILRSSGERRTACRHFIAAAELRRRDAAILGEALRCTREQGQDPVARALLEGVEESVRARAELTKPTGLGAAWGEVRLEATWSGDGEADLALVDPDGRRVSWLGGPGKAVVRVTDAVSLGREVLAFSGGKPGEYRIEATRARGEGLLRGEVLVTGVGGVSRKLPFVLDGARATVGSVRLSWKRTLVPVGTSNRPVLVDR